MKLVETCTFEARMARLVDATDFAENFCLRHGLAHAVAMRLVLVIEELFTNTVEHGHGGDCAAPVRLVLSIDDADLGLLYEDSAPPFDPLAHRRKSRPDLDRPAASRPVGGRGIPLVRGLAVSARHAFENGHNRLWIVLRREA